MLPRNRPAIDRDDEDGLAALIPAMGMPAVPSSNQYLVDASEAETSAAPERVRRVENEHQERHPRRPLRRPAERRIGARIWAPRATAARTFGSAGCHGCCRLEYQKQYARFVFENGSSSCRRPPGRAVPARFVAAERSASVAARQRVPYHRVRTACLAPTVAGRRNRRRLWSSPQ